MAEARSGVAKKGYEVISLVGIGTSIAKAGRIMTRIMRAAAVTQYAARFVKNAADEFAQERES